ncbi:anibiotic ABC transporter efflux pump [Streptosporangiaceae bacterium NEAU-GS5]|nr:anibiotic ABC transporter efflux pump [Streptosporangiaceae bacterium NEAU-GS5]
MTAFAATGALTRFALRRERARLTTLTVVLVGLLALSVPALAKAYATAEQQQERAKLMRTPVGIIFGGPGYGLGHYTIGPMVVNEMLPVLVIALIIVNVLIVIRHTRAEEETGRAELIRAAAVGRRAPITSALLTCLAGDVVIGALTALVLAGGNLPAADSAATGLGLALTGLSFAAITVVIAQVTAHARTAVGLSALAFGGLYLLRVLGDFVAPGGSTLSWFSPSEWVFQARPYVELRWWPLALHAILFVVAVPVAYLLAAHRDVGTGLVAPRPGPAVAGRWLSGTLALHLRLQRGTVITWTIVAALLGLFYGGLSSQVSGMFQKNPDTIRMFGGDLSRITDGFLATMLVYVSILSTIVAIVSVTRIRSEERDGRAEIVLATPTGRVRWMGTALLTGAVTATVTQILGGFCLALTASGALRDPGLLGTLSLATFNYLPIPLLFAGVAALVFGLFPRAATALPWALLGLGLAVTLLSGLIELPAWMKKLSPFNIPALVPLQDVDATPLLAMGGAAVVAAALGLVAFRLRDLAATA